MTFLLLRIQYLHVFMSFSLRVVVIEKKLIHLEPPISISPKTLL